MRGNWRKVNLMAAGLCLALLVFSPSLAVAQPITAVGDYNYPPYAYLGDKNQPTGFEVDLLRAVAAASDLDIEISLKTWAQAREDFSQGQAQMITGMVRTPEREREVAFSAPIHYLQLAIFARPDFAFREIGDLTGRRVAVQAGDWAEEELKRQKLAVLIVPCESPIDCLYAVQTGDADCAVILKMQGKHYLAQEKIQNIETIDGGFPVRPYCFAVRPDQPELLAALDEGLRQIRDDGTYDQIRAKWFGAHYQREGRKLAYQIVSLIALPLLCIFAAILVWVYLMRRTVREKTRKLMELNLELEERVTERARQLEEAAQQLREAELAALREEKQTSMLTMVSGIAHEINTPLGNAKVSLSYLEEAVRQLELSAEESFLPEQLAALGMVREGMELTDVNLRRVADMINRLRELDSQKYQGGEMEFSLDGFLRELEPIFAARLQARGHRYRWQSEADLQVVANPQVLRDILTQLLENAMVHGLAGRREGWLRITGSRAGNMIKLQVENSGQHIPEAELPRVFEPFFTTSVGEGSKGLGLSVVQNMVQSVLGGNIVCENSADGVKFIMRFPGKD